jgi:hypothetical protein
VVFGVVEVCDILFRAGLFLEVAVVIITVGDIILFDQAIVVIILVGRGEPIFGFRLAVANVLDIRQAGGGKTTQTGGLREKGTDGNEVRWRQGGITMHCCPVASSYATRRWIGGGKERNSSKDEHRVAMAIRPNSFSLYSNDLSLNSNPNSSIVTLLRTGKDINLIAKK